MNRLDVQLENCFGIGSFKYVFDFKSLNTNSFVIYAPNGTMKTSFSKTFDLISKATSDNKPSDRIFENRVTECRIEVDDNVINAESILVIDAEDVNYDSTSKISSFIASKDLKEEYDTIYSHLDTAKRHFIKKLKDISQSNDCEVELMSTFATTDNTSFFEMLLSITQQKVLNPVKYSFRYNDIFDKNGAVKKFLEKNQQLLTQYIAKYKELLSQSFFLRGSTKNSFGTYQANLLLNSLEDNSFFDAGHKFALDGDLEIKSVGRLKELIEEDHGKIINDPELKKKFDQVDKALGANAGVRQFKLVIEKDNSLLIKLEDYESFRKEVWLNYISNLDEDVQSLLEVYKSKKGDLARIIEDAGKEFKVWQEIVNKFNSRFYVPFKVSIANQIDIVLKSETATLLFEYKDSESGTIKKDRSSLLSILSRGERRAYFILQMLFDIESRKKNTLPTLVIFDDIADSFDYKNKYAIIEYIRELHCDNQFKLIILTHNFDFYRTVTARLDINRKACFMATKSNERKIELFELGYRESVIKYFKKNVSRQKIFISTIPFLRNIIEYTKDQTGLDYLKLTSCLHIKATTDQILCSEIFDLMKNYLDVSGTISFGSKKIKEAIYESADALALEPSVNTVLLENKIVLSIATRLKSEEFMISKTGGSITFDSNQTRKLFNSYREISDDENAISILDRVNLMTPENLHVNAFMYEPLIDIGTDHLLDLYAHVKALI